MKTSIYINIIVCCFSIVSCRSKQDIAHKSATEARVERLATVVDSAQFQTEKKQKKYESKIDTSKIYTRTTVYGDNGQIQSIQESWRDIRRFELGIRQGQGNYLSLARSSVSLSEVDTVTQTTQTEVTTTSDSRLVQGGEWVIIIVSLIVVLSIILLTAKK